MTAMSYFADLGHAIVHVVSAAFILAVIVAAFWTVVAIGERHVRRVEQRRALTQWRRRESRTRVVNVRDYEARP